MRERLSPEIFNLPINKIKNNFYSDRYFERTREILIKDNYDPQVLVQVFQRKQAILCGIDEAIAILKTCAEKDLKIKALYDGDKIDPWETVMTIEGHLSDFIHLETVFLGALSRQTKIATNVAKIVKASGSIPVLFFPSRFDHYSVQERDGYAAKIGGVQGVSTPANGLFWQEEAVGTMPHALIAAYGGDTVKAAIAFDKHIDKKVKRLVLVDYENDCVKTSLDVAAALGDALWGVRLDTAENLVDKSVIPQMGNFKPNGVCDQLIYNVRNALDESGYSHVKIIVTGGLNEERVQDIVKNKVPVDMFGVGSFFLKGSNDFTADVVIVEGKLESKVGRNYIPNERLEDVK